MQVGLSDFRGRQMVKRRTKRRGWSAEDIRRLKALARRKKPAVSIGRTLNRTENATRQKAFSLGLSLETRAGRTRNEKHHFRDANRTAGNPAETNKAHDQGHDQQRDNETKRFSAPT